MQRKKKKERKKRKENIMQTRKGCSNVAKEKKYQSNRRLSHS